MSFYSEVYSHNSISKKFTTKYCAKEEFQEYNKICNCSGNTNQSYFSCSLTRAKKLLKVCIPQEKKKPLSLKELLVPVHNCRGSVGLPFRHNQLCQLKQDLCAPFLLKQSISLLFSLVPK